MIWQLLQVNHLPRDTPLLLVGTMWSGLVKWVREFMLLLDPPLSRPMPGGRRRIVSLAWSLRAALAIVPFKDLLNLGTAARMNVPGCPEGNWRWCFTIQPAVLGDCRKAIQPDRKGEQFA